MRVSGADYAEGLVGYKTQGPNLHCDGPRKGLPSRANRQIGKSFSRVSSLQELLLLGNFRPRPWPNVLRHLPPRCLPTWREKAIENQCCRESQRFNKNWLQSYHIYIAYTRIYIYIPLVMSPRVHLHLLNSSGCDSYFGEDLGRPISPCWPRLISDSLGNVQWGLHLAWTIKWSEILGDYWSPKTWNSQEATHTIWHIRLSLITYRYI